MFVDTSPKAQLRLIDFGSGRIDPDPLRASGQENGDAKTETATARTTNGADNKGTDDGTGNNDSAELQTHTTFAGSAFYISPEMFQRTYTSRTDVWSAGVTLYVLVAGYPADALQKTFNLLHTASVKNRNLRKLPNMPDDMPDSYYELLEGLLTYRHKRRPSAGQMLESEFVQFHKRLEEEEEVGTVGVAENNAGLSVEDISSAAMSAAAVASSSNGDGSFGRNTFSGRTASIRLAGSVGRHGLVLGFKKFERGVTAILATMLSKDELDRFLAEVENRTATAPKDDEGGVNGDGHNDDEKDRVQQQKQLHVILVNDLKGIVRDELKNVSAVEAMDNLANSSTYGTYAYHVSLLKEVIRLDDNYGPKQSNGGGNSSRRALRHSSSFSSNAKRSSFFGGGGRQGRDEGTNNSSQSATPAWRRMNAKDIVWDDEDGNGKAQISSSVHGTNVYSTLMKSKNGARKNGRQTQSVYVPAT